MDDFIKKSILCTIGVSVLYQTGYFNTVYANENSDCLTEYKMQTKVENIIEDVKKKNLSKYVLKDETVDINTMDLKNIKSFVRTILKKDSILSKNERVQEDFIKENDVSKKTIEVYDNKNENRIIDENVYINMDERENIEKIKIDKKVEENLALYQDGRKQKNDGFFSKKVKSNIEIEKDMNDNILLNKQEQKNISVFNRLNMLVPEWTYSVFDDLLQKNLLHVMDDKTMSAISMKYLTRREAAILIARGYRFSSYLKNIDETILNDINILMNEFLPELEAMGYDVHQYVQGTKVIDKEKYKWNFNGEIRYNYMANDGAPKYTWNDSRIRIRTNAERNISDNWQIVTMLEGNKSFLRDINDLDLRRYYFRGQENIWGYNVNLEIGHTYNYLGDGNILDADYKGIKVKTSLNKYLDYYTGWGKVNDYEDLWYNEFIYKRYSNEYLWGNYHWDNYGRTDNIYMTGINNYIGNYKLGALLFYSDLADRKGNKSGYVLSAVYGKDFEWIKGTYEVGFRYYNMPENTYITHTMSGLADYMKGFSGWSVIAKYTILENVMLGLEYYDIKDKITDERGKTTWIELTYSWD